MKKRTFLDILSATGIFLSIAFMAYMLYVTIKVNRDYEKHIKSIPEHIIYRDTCLDINKKPHP